LGINMVDLADIYGSVYGECEAIFGHSLQRNPAWRDKLIIQSKCAIVMNRERHTFAYDFSKPYILKSVDDSLKRLGIETLDVLLLHRPDALMEPEEVAEAFDELESEGKVRHFGVSNMNSMQLELLQRGVKQPLKVNQLQFGPAHTAMLDQAIRANTGWVGSENRDGSILDYCRLNGITIQAWSPYRSSVDHALIIDNPALPKLNQALREVGNAHGISPMGVVAAWISRHPAGIQTIAGTTRPDRLAEIASGMDLRLSREEWYKIYIANDRELP
jgi:predicted oxidoreductase